MKAKLAQAWNTFQITMKSLRQRQRKVLDQYAKDIEQKKIDAVRKKLG